MKNILHVLCVLISVSMYGQQLADNYIDTYKEIAIAEMNRTGVPASIKLAQGLLESDWGRSDLAFEANNHFGIKCAGGWTGDDFYKLDDDRDKFGRVVKSCFRAYRHAEESYIAHSEFLLGQEKRYGFLFEYETTDYKSWAKGLRKAGYATDPSYSKKLITIIEKFELYQYDDNQSLYAQNDKKAGSQQNGYPGLRTDAIKLNAEEDEEKNKAKYSFNNEVQMVLSRGDENLTAIAKRHRISVDKMIEYNDGIYTKDDVILANKRIYLEKKKVQYAGRNKFHEVRPGDKMVSIAQHYGIQTNALYVRNRMPTHAEIVPGELIQLKGIRTGKKPRFKSNVHKKANESIFKKADKMLSYYFTEEGLETDN